MAPTATRVLVNIARRCPFTDSAWDKPEEVVAAALKFLVENSFVPSNPDNSLPTPKLVAKHRMGRIAIVFDVFNEKYDPVTAHLKGTNDLPLIMVHMGVSTKAATATAGMTDRINEEVRKLHDSNGFGSEVPFSVDYSDGQVPTYWNPRSMVRQTSTPEDASVQ